MNILINGICGHMGRELAALCERGCRGARLAAGVDPSAQGGEAPVSVKSFCDMDGTDGIDCIIDFSHHSCVTALLDFALRRKIPVVVATTGHTEEELSEIRAASERIPVFFSANMSLGIALLVELAKTAARAMPDAEIEIIEKHHDRKLDAPSGTALMIADSIREVRPASYAHNGRSGHGKRSFDEIGIHSVRIGNVVGEHEVIIGTDSQTVTLKHEAHSRALFAEGALAAAEFIVGRRAGLYDMMSLVESTAKKDEPALSLR